MSAHTPGPWGVHWEANITGYPAYYIHGLSGDQKRDETTLDANALLISLAPELVEALDALLRAVEGTAGGHLSADVLEGAVVTTARNLLQRARGKDPSHG